MISILNTLSERFDPNKGDIMLTPNTAQRLIPFRTSQNDKLSRAFTSKKESFWTENKKNGYYIIGYTINNKLDSLNKQTIPKVSPIFRKFEIIICDI